MFPVLKTGRFSDGGIQATGNYPGKARNASELRADLEQAMRLIPGPKRQFACHLSGVRHASLT